MNEDYVFEKVRSIIADKCCIDYSEISMKSDFTQDIGLDSLDVVELIMEFEKEFNITIPDGKSAEILTVGEAVHQIYYYVQENKKNVLKVVVDTNLIDDILAKSSYDETWLSIPQASTIAKKIDTSKLTLSDYDRQYFGSFEEKLHEFEDFATSMSKQTLESIQRIEDNLWEHRIQSDVILHNIIANRGNRPIDKYDVAGGLLIMGLKELVNYHGEEQIAKERQKLFVVEKEIYEREKQWAMFSIKKASNELKDLNDNLQSLSFVYKQIARKKCDKNNVMDSELLKCFESCFTLYLRMIYAQQKTRHALSLMIDMVYCNRLLNNTKFDKTMDFYCRNEINKWPNILEEDKFSCMEKWNNLIIDMLTSKSGSFPIVIYKLIY